MTAGTTGLGESFVAAIQASLSVLLVIFYGVVAAWLNILNPSNTKAISKVCVRLFLPALLFTNIGSELHVENAGRYLTIFIWAIACHFISFLIGTVVHVWVGLPDWTTAALMFNNTTSYPLLLIAALDQTGILASLITTDETTRHAIERAKSYFLVFATVSSCLAFAVGPRLIDSEHAIEEEDEDKHQSDDEQSDSGDDSDEVTRSQTTSNEETGLLAPPRPLPHHTSSRNSFFPSARRPSTNSQLIDARRRPSMLIPIAKKKWYTLGPRARWWLLFISDFFNAPLLGAIAGVVVGLVPALHKAFFNDTYEGGIFTAWLTSSLDNIGGLFVPLPVVVAGVSLYTARVEAKRTGRAGVRLPWKTVTFILVVRFVIWSVASIAFVYALASRTDILGDDPMLWFAMMLMPTGPPAMKLITLVQVSDGDDAEEAIIAKLLTISYLISPILSFTVVGSLRASQAAL